jgi:hypothetical protein
MVGCSFHCSNHHIHNFIRDIHGNKKSTLLIHDLQKATLNSGFRWTSGLLLSYPRRKFGFRTPRRASCRPKRKRQRMPLKNALERTTESPSSHPKVLPFHRINQLQCACHPVKTSLKGLGPRSPASRTNAGDHRVLQYDGKCHIRIVYIASGLTGSTIGGTPPRSRELVFVPMLTP